MKHKPLIKTVWVAIVATSIVFIAQTAGNDDIARVREATVQFHRIPVARSAGYELITGLDHCFQNYGVGGMGYHFINIDLLDTTLDVLHPEALIYAPDANGSIQLGAVEYMVPAVAWDSENSDPPQILGQSLHLHERLEMYLLHAWIWKDNPSGIFEDWNPDISCPVPLQWNGPMRWR